MFWCEVNEESVELKDGRNRGEDGGKEVSSRLSSREEGGER